MAVAAKPEISKILLDLGIEPVDVYAVDNAEKTYIAALVEGINTLEVANKGESTRSKILRDEVKRIRDKKRKVSASKLFAKKSIIPTKRINPQALLPAAADTTEKKSGGFASLTKAVQGIINILKLGNKQDKKEFEIDQKENQRERREKREKALEAGAGALKAAAGLGKKIVSTLISPFKAVWEAITNFLKVVVAGFLFNKVFDWFLDPANERKINSIGRFLKDFWPSLVVFGALFLTPLGGIIKGLLSFVGWAIPWLWRLIARNPLLAGGILLGGLTAAQLMKKMEDQQNQISEEFLERRSAGESNITREEVESEYFKRNGTILGNLSGGILNNMVNPLSRVFSTGGKVSGPPHSRGGIDINVEGDEYVVNKKRTAILGPILDWLNFGDLSKRPPQTTFRGDSRDLSNPPGQTTFSGDLSNRPVMTTPMGLPSLQDPRFLDLFINFLKSAKMEDKGMSSTINNMSSSVSSNTFNNSTSSFASTPKTANIGKKSLRVPTPTPPSRKITIMKDTEVLPPITQASPRQGTDGKTLPTFNIMSSSTHRVVTLIALDLD